MSRTDADAPYQLLPLLRDQEFQALRQDIARRGIMVPIERDESGNVLDGHHRLRALEELRAEGYDLPDAPVIVRVGLSEAEKRFHVRSLNVHRRHLSAAQRRAVIEEQLRETPDRSDRALAHALAVSPTTVGMVRRRLGGGATVQNGQSERRLGRDGKRRRVPASRAIIASSDSEAVRALTALEVVPAEALPERFLTAKDATTAARMVRREHAREQRIERLRDPGALRGIGRGKYVVVYADPPWQYAGASDPTRRAANHYPTMSHQQLLDLPVGDIAARSAVLVLWCTPPKVAEAVELIQRWGFSYKTCAVWDKIRVGLGSWFRQQHELLLIATRGDVPAPSPIRRAPSVFRIERGEHSAKPHQVRAQLERMFPKVPRVELFARGAVPGWDVWGFEAEPHDGFGT